MQLGGGIMSMLYELTEKLNENLESYKEEIDFIFENSGSQFTKDELYQICEQIFFSIGTFQSNLIDYLKDNE